VCRIPTVDQRRHPGRRGDLMPDINVRGFQQADVDDLARLWQAAWMATGILAGSVPTLDDYRARLVAEDWRIRVATDGSRIVGFLAFNQQKSWLRQLFVCPDMQRSGVGTKLLETARREMPDGFWLRTDAHNHQARRFYERRGLRAEGEAPNSSGGMTARYRWP
jgi:GNAT superfamily N-acetyltransferase